MPLPERLQPAKVNRQKLKQLADMAEEILAQIDNGAKEEDTGLKMLINDWNSGLLTRMHSLISGISLHGPVQKTSPGWRLIKKNTWRIYHGMS